ncbi:hypothetical protein HQ560_00425, partial [bacterium]|nr:hypothetical protein [bacterium]
GGVIGLIGFECLKIYKRAWSDQPFSPRKQLLLYLLSLVGLAVFSGFAAVALAPGNFAHAIFLGFSIPNGAKAILAPAHRKGNQPHADVNDVAVDDVEFEEDRRRGPLAAWYELMFSFS